MEHPETHVVTPENGPRPAGRPDQCFYCRQPLGEPHKESCGCRLRTVVVRAVIEYTVSVAADWDVDMVEFHRNGSSWCADNLLDELTRISEARGCLCAGSGDMVHFSYVREASREDEIDSFGREGLGPLPLAPEAGDA